MHARSYSPASPPADPRRRWMKGLYPLRTRSASHRIATAFKPGFPHGRLALNARFSRESRPLVPPHIPSPSLLIHNGHRSIEICVGRPAGDLFLSASPPTAPHARDVGGSRKPFVWICHCVWQPARLFSFSAHVKMISINDGQLGESGIPHRQLVTFPQCVTVLGILYLALPWDRGRK